MPRWKTTQNLLNVKNDGEFFDDNWMNYDRIWQYAPEPIPWDGNREIKFEDVDLWEVILEETGPFGVYGAWCPYAEYYIVMHHWRIIEEFVGYMANERLENYLILNKIDYPKGSTSPTPIKNTVVEKKIIVPGVW